MQIRSLLGVTVLAACGAKATPAPVVGNSGTGQPPRELQHMPPSSGLAAPWIAKLDDPREAERAVTELEQLGDPSAIDPLGKHWNENGRPVRVLQVMISLSRPLTPDQAKAQFVTDYEATGRPASWARLVPYLRTAVASIDMENPRSVDNAVKAASIAEEARLAVVLPELLELVGQPEHKKWISAQIAAIRAIGAIGGAEATRALLALIAHEPPAHPRMAKTKEDGRQMEERFGLHLARTGAAINALGGPPSAEAAVVLIKQLYITPELFTQIRRALVANGPAVSDQLRAILRGEHEAVNQLFRDKHLDRYCGDRGDLPPAQCRPLSTKDFYPAVILGDLHDAKAVPDLLAALERPPLPAYYMDDQPGVATQHNAIFDSLRKLGAAQAAAPVRTMWKTAKLDVVTRTLAVATYAFVARTDADVDDLGKIAADNTADDMLRQEAATAYARLARDPKHIQLLLTLAKRYTDESAKKRKAADAAMPGTLKANPPLAKAQKAHADAKARLLAIAQDPASTTAQIKTATASAKQSEETYKAAKRKHRDQTAPYRMQDQAATAYLSYARMFQTHVARIEVAIRCKEDIACYGASLKLTAAEAEARVVSYIPDVAAWTNDEKSGLVEAMIERSMLELGKRGAAAAELTDTLLDAAHSDTRIIRQSILLALPHIAKRPCPRCVTKLDRAIKAGEGKTTLGDLNLETTMLRNYFQWAK